MGHARALLPLDKNMQIKLAEKIVARQLTVREIENLIRNLQEPSDSKKMKNILSESFLTIQASISKHLGQKVSLAPGSKGGGKMVIHYKSRAELDKLIAYLDRKS